MTPTEPAPRPGPPVTSTGTGTGTDGGSGSDRDQLLLRAVAAWTDQLVDLGGRNSLLHFRELRAGTLDLGIVSAPDALARFLSTGVARLSQIVVDSSQLPDAARRCRAIRAKANEMYEERGVVTLHLARDIATWSPQRGTAIPAAPLVVQPLTVTPRSLGGDDYDLRLDGDAVVNPVLLHALRSEFNVSFDEASLDALIDDDTDTALDMAALRATFTDMSDDVPGFAIRPTTVIGNFSYAKLPMVLDLQHAVASGALAASDIVTAVAGDLPARERIRARRVEVDVSAPDHQPLADEFCVLDADASQSHAINTVIGGEHLIIKGPPGTGKSQTISNLIAALCARGQRVLFVAEKRAAIDAVTKRLVQQGLGDLVLDVHGGVLAKRTLARQLADALRTASTTPLPALDALHAELERERQALNEYARALHQVRSPWETTVYQLQCDLIGLAHARSGIRIRAEALRSIDAVALRDRSSDLHRLCELGGLDGLHGAGGSPWATSTISNESDARAALAAAQTVASVAPGELAEIERVCAATGQRPPSSFDEWRQLATRLDATEALLRVVQAAVFDLDLPTIITSLAPARRNLIGRAIAATFDTRYRAAKRMMRGVAIDDDATPRQLLDAAVNASTCASDWRLHGNRPPGAPPSPRFARLAEVNAALARIAAHIPTIDVASLALTDIVPMAQSLAADTATLGKLPEIHALRSRLRDAGFSELLDALCGRADRDATLEPSDAVAALRACVADSALDDIRLTDRAIGAFDGRGHDRLTDSFRTRDRDHVRTTVTRVQRLVAERIIAALDAHPEQAEIVQREAAKKTRHLPFRDLFAAAPDVLTAVKPCWAMSPLVVSQLLPAVPGLFDVVVFDEASQITPADAMPAIMRGRQLVVTGDDRQLPPTTFFATTADALDADPIGESRPPVVDATEAVEDLALTRGFESILDALSPLVGSRLRMLLWHYRSRDERLIAFSNAHFYDRALTTFPGALPGDVINHVLVDGHSDELVGPEVESSSAEVRRVVAEILDHARTRPTESLGVIAMGIKHATRVEAALHEALRDTTDPVLVEFFRDRVDEPFFVKNLERVQGDERDAIILTIGYGKDASGKLPYRFGPLLTEGGERRLNVAVTRAKRRMTVVSSFSALDMDPGRSTKPGVQLLRSYLEFAASSGNRLDAEAASIPPLNPFKVAVRDALTAAGVPVVAQFGVSGYRIDFAAMHHDQPGRPVLAIECDGASYHSQPTARARDRLRQDQLERLGWTFHRIWSTSFFADPEREVARVVEAWKRACSAAAPTPVPSQSSVTPAATPEVTATEANEPPSPAVSAPEPSPTANVDTAPTRGVRPSIGRRESIDDYADDELRALLRWIRSDTLLRTSEQTLDAMIDELGFARRGRRIVERLTKLIATAET